MINPTREQVAVALFALLQTASASFNTISRRPQLWDDTTAMPALYMGQPNEDYAYQHGTATPAVVTMEFDVYLYIKTSQDNAAPDTAMNSAIDALESALQPTAATNFVQTLGGIVNHCWIEGPIHRAPGYINGQGMAILTIKALVPQ